MEMDIKHRVRIEEEERERIQMDLQSKKFPFAGVYNK